MAPSLLRVRDASGGLNVRDAAVALGANESPDSYNVTLDERGGVGKRLGYEKSNSTAFGGGIVKNVFFWEAGGNKITQAGASLYKDNDTAAFKTFTTAARCGMADFLGKLYMIHPVDGLFTYDGATVAAVADPDAPKGDVLLPWQGKLFAAGNPTNKARVAWSSIADGTLWATADFNDLREKDGEKVVSLDLSSGGDDLGRQGLVACKRESTYRIHDSTTGAYVTLDASIGAASALATVNLLGRIYAISEHGIFSTDGTSAMQEESERLRPLFTAGRINLAQLDLFAAGTIGDRAYFSLPQAGAGANNLAYEFHPKQRWIVPRSDAMSCYATYGLNDEYLIGGSPTVTGQVYRLNKGGSDDGAVITSLWQTRWFEPSDGMLAAMIELQILGRTEGTATLTVRKDYDASGGEQRTLDIGDPIGSWDSGLLWDDGHLWGPTKLQEYQRVHSLGTCRAFSLIIEETSSLVGTGTQYLRQGTAPEVGAWSVYGFDLKYVPLGG